MTVFPASAALLAIWLLQTLRNPDNGVIVTLALLPFGMFAAITLGDLSVIAAHLVAMLTVAALVLRRISQRQPVGNRGLSTAGLFLIAFSVYALISGTVLVRLFAGEFLVFPMTVSNTGTAVSIFFNSTMKPLAPGSSNLAQSLYILLSCGFFIALSDTFQRRSANLGERGLMWAASLNVILGMLDMAQADQLLEIIRTADYSLGNEHTLSGLARVIGGYSEASAFGAASAAFFGYFMMSYLVGHRPLHAALAFANLACTLLSLSSSGLLSMAAALVFIGFHIRVYLGVGVSRSFGHWFVILIAALFAGLSMVTIFTPASDLVADVVDRLVFSKAGSMSGIERSAWARSGLDAFVQTWGLGAGVGSLRSNGLAPVLLGSVGLPGTLMFLAFLWFSIGPRPAFATPDDRRMFYAARISALTLLVAMMLAGTTPDPTLFLVATTAIATSARQRSAMIAPTQAPSPTSRAAERGWV